MRTRFKKIVAIGLLASNFFQVALAAFPTPTNNPSSKRYNQNAYAHKYTPTSIPVDENLNLSLDQLGLSGPVNGNVNYSSLTGVYFNAELLKKISEKLGLGIIGEYGEKQYRINGTLGFFVAAQALFKISLEQLSQRLPFSFDTGRVEKRVHQNAVGARFQQYFDHTFLDNLSLGAYGAKTPSKRLSTVSFISNGSNCLSYGVGVECLNERHISGATSSGADLGLGAYLTPSTYFEGRVYYDASRYHNIFYQSFHRLSYDKQGYGGGIFAQQLLSPTLKLSASAELRRIYDTYNLALSWMPPRPVIESELSVMAQRTISHDNIPNDNIIGLKFTAYVDRLTYKPSVYRLNGAPGINDITTWVRQPAVKMDQVLAIAEQYTHLANTAIISIVPNFGSIRGGNTIVINGSNFASNTNVRIGNQLAVITAISPSAITLTVPPGMQAGLTSIDLYNPQTGKTITLDNAYLYIQDGTPVVSQIYPNIVNVAGGINITITGSQFVPAQTSLIVGGIAVTPSAVTANDITFTAPAHAPGEVTVSIITPAGKTDIANAINYVTTPFMLSLTPTLGPVAGGTLATITGEGFIPGNTVVTITNNDTLKAKKFNTTSIVIPANKITVNDSGTALTYTMPAHEVGNVTAAVSVAGGPNTAVPGSFQYVETPTATSLTPQTGPTLGGTIITVTGTNFIANNTSVTVGDIVIPANSVFVDNQGTTLTFATPAHPVGSVSVVVMTAGGSSNAKDFVYQELPIINSLTPNTGSTAGGTLVTVSGSGFDTTSTAVTLAGNPVTGVNIISDSTITFVTPAGNSGAVNVIVTTPSGSSNEMSFTYQAGPSLNTLSPNQGSTMGGTTVTLVGSGFNPADTTVTVGGHTASSVNVITSTQLTFVTPQGQVGNASVIASTPAGSSNAVDFTYFATPMLTALSPAQGSSAGGTTVTVSGSNFTSAAIMTVSINGSPAQNVTVISSTEFTFVTPASNPGNAVVVVSTPGGISNSLIFNYDAIPALTSLNPIEGSTVGGTTVTVLGSGFNSANTYVSVNNSQADNVNVISDSQLTFVTPSGQVGNASVVVTTPSGTSNGLSFTYDEQPALISISPAQGNVAGGTVVTLTGSGFTATTQVSVAGSELINTTVISSSTLTFITPAGQVGSSPVVVTTLGGTSNALSFNYDQAPALTLLSPSEGDVAGGTVVTVSGNGFSRANTTVSVGDNAALNVVVISPSQLTFTTPQAQAPGNVPVIVTTLQGSSNSLDFTYDATPVITTISPAQGSNSGGNTITISGNNFSRIQTTVMIGGNAAGDVTVLNSNELTCIAPAGVAGSAPVVVTTPGGSSNSLAYTYNTNAVPVLTSLSPNEGSVAGGMLLTLTGSGFTSTNLSVTLAGHPATNINVISSTQITLTTPAGSPGSAPVIVTTLGGNSNHLNYIYDATPSLTSITPNDGNVAGGTIVTVDGSGFSQANTVVNVGNNVATMVNVISNTQLTFETPSAIAGSTTVTVTTPGGTSNGLSFTYNQAPALTSLSPDQGSIAGGTIVTIVGKGFDSTGTTVSVAENNASDVTVISATQLTFVTPSGQTGSVPVVVTTAQGSSNNLMFTYQKNPGLTSLMPTEGSTAGGLIVTINGKGFTSDGTTVTIGGKPANNINVISPTQLTFETPKNQAGNVDVVVMTAFGTSNSLAFKYDAMPELTMLTPNQGNINGGNTVTITGRGFYTANTLVNINANAATNINILSDNELSFVTPKGQVGNAQVTVTTPGGSSNSLIFTYVAVPQLKAITPAEGSIAGGTLVTITGSGFSLANTMVNVGSNEATNITVISATELTCTIPAGSAGTMPVIVTTAGGSSQSLSFTYDAEPVLTTLSPNEGSSAGGTIVTASGSSFSSTNTTVSVGGATAQNVNVISSTSLTFTTPAGDLGDATVIITTPGGSSHGLNFNYDNAPALNTLTPIEGSITGGSLVTLTGSNFSLATTTVSVDGNAATSINVISTSELTFVTPAGRAGGVSVIATTPGGRSNNLTFNYIAEPTLTGITPSEGSSAGGTVVTLTGSGFSNNSTNVNINGTMITNPTVVSSTQLTFITPISNTGTFSVNVVTAGGTSNSLKFTYDPAPILTALSPAQGPANGGTTVTVSGSGFNALNTSVSIGGVVGLNVAVINATTLTFVTPSATAGSAEVVITTPGGSSNELSFVYQPAPTLTAITPAEASTNGGTVITLNGSGFSTPGIAVNVGSNAATNINIINDNQLTFTVPAGNAGDVMVMVTTVGGSSSALSFTYDAAPAIKSLTPSQGSIAGGTTVTVTGSGFRAGLTTVTVGDKPVADLNIISATALSFVTPAASAAGSANVVVTTPGGHSNALVFIYDAVPTLVSLTPVEATITGGTTVTVIGSGFSTVGTSVNIGGNIANNITVISDTQLTFQTPQHQAGSVSVTVTTFGGSSNVLMFNYDAMPTLATLSPAAGSIAGGTTVTVTGTNFSTLNTLVTVGGENASNINVINSTQLTFTTPQSPAGNAQVLITTPGGSSNNLNFTYDATPTLNALSPTEGATAGGTIVTITGSNFTALNTTVTINGVNATNISVVSATELSFTMPAGIAGNAGVVVTTPGGSSNTLVFIYDASPTITSLTPAQGNSAGGNTITLIGTNFSTLNTTVTVAGNQANNVDIISATALTFVTPAGQVGNAEVTVSTPGGISNRFNYNYNPIPVLASLSPSQGNISGGTVVTITGSGFNSTDTVVNVNGVVLNNVDVISSTILTFVTPANNSGDVTITVTTPGGVSSELTFAYDSVPALTSLTPNQGNTAGGTIVTIKGNGFIENNTTVSIGMTPATNITVVSSKQLTFVTPAGSVGGVPVIVTTPNGSSNSANFTYDAEPSISAISPVQGSNVGNTIVTVTGSGFSTTNTTATIGGVSAININVISDTKLTLVTPAGSGVAQVIVTTPGGTSNGATFIYNNEPIPTLSGLTPSEGSNNGGTTVTLSGSGFDPNTTVTVGGNAGTNVIVVNATTLTFVTPAGNAGNANVVVTTLGGSSNNLVFTYDNIPNLTALSPVEGSTLGGTTVTINGTNFSSANTTVTVNGNSGTNITIVSGVMLTFVAPAGSVGNANVTVTTPGGNSNSLIFTYDAQPNLNTINPAQGNNAGGTLVTINGTGFSTVDTTVTVGGNLANNVNVISSNELTLVTPAGMGAVPIVVTTPGGNSNSLTFTYDGAPNLTSLAPMEGASMGGTIVTINGSGFDTNSTNVTVNGVNATAITLINDNQLTFTAPANSPGSAEIIITTPGGSSNGLYFTYDAIPALTAINPAQGSISGGTTVTLTGNDFSAAYTAVMIGQSQALNVKITSATSLTFVTPSGSVGTSAVTVTTPGGSSNSLNFSYDPAPSLTALMPNEGNSAGGTTVTINGSGFDMMNTTVNVGGTPATNINVINSTQLTFVTPQGQPGLAEVIVTTLGGSSNSLNFTYDAEPMISALTPAEGMITGGTTVTVTGSGFSALNTSVNVAGNVASNVTVQTSTTLTFVTPAGGAGSATVSVTTPGGISNPLTFTYDAIPNITLLSPSQGSVTGGTIVTVSGNGFNSANTSVLVGNKTATMINVVSDTQLTFKTPKAQAGIMSVSVTTPGGSSNGLNFTYDDIPNLTAITPAEGGIAGGTTVTLMGSGFINSNTSITVGGTQATNINIISGNQLTFITPASNAGGAEVVVTTPGGSSNSLLFTYDALPALTVLSPAEGSVAGGTTVTINGSGFVSANTTVSVAGIAATNLTIISDTELTAVTPQGQTGNAQVVVTTPGGTSNALNFIYDAVPSLTSLSPAQGPVAGGTTVTLNGSGFISGNVDVTVAGIAASSINVTSATQLTFITPANNAGNAEVVINTLGGTSNSLDFTYDPLPTLTALNPSQGSVAGGTTVTVTGNGFVSGGSIVTINGVAASNINVINPTQLTFVTPQAPSGLAAVIVSTAGGDSNSLSFTYDALPVLTSLSPNQGPTVGGLTVTIIGSGFVNNNTAVLVGGHAASNINVISSTQLTMVTPAGTVGNALVTVTTPGGSNNNLSFTYDEQPAITSINPIAGSVTGGTTVTVNGSGFIAANTSVTIGGNTGTTVNVISNTQLTFVTPQAQAGAAPVIITTPGGSSNALTFTYYPVPTESSLTPMQGSTAGGTTVTLNGSGFSSSSLMVTVGGKQATSINVVNSMQLTFVTPTGSAGTASVVVTTLGGNSNGLNFTYISPTLAACSATMPTGQLQVLTCLGANLNLFTAPSFINVTAGAGCGISPGVLPIPAISLFGQVISTLPVGTGNLVGCNVQICSSSNCSALGINTGAVGVTANYPTPSIALLSPAAGSIQGNTVMTITGTGFVTSGTTINVGGTVIPATAVTVNNIGTSLSFTTPVGVAAGVAEINVTTAGGTSNNLPFNYLAPSLSSCSATIPSAGAQSVTCLGTNLTLFNLASFINVLSGSSCNVVPGTQLIPAISLAGNVIATLTVGSGNLVGCNLQLCSDIACSAQSLDTNAVTVAANYPVPSALLLSSNTGSIQGGTVLTVTGTGFVAGNTTVTIGSTVIPATAVTVNSSATTLSFTTPAETVAGTQTLTVTTAGGTSNSLPFTYIAPTLSQCSASIPISGSQAVTCLGTNLNLFSTPSFINVLSANSCNVTPGTQAIPAVSLASGVSATLAVGSGNLVGCSLQICDNNTCTALNTGIVAVSANYPIPVLTTLSNSSGTVKGGTIINVSGTGFVTGNTSVIIGGNTVAASAVTVNSTGTSLSFSTPAATTTGVQPVTVITAGGTSNALLFTYLAPSLQSCSALTPTLGLQSLTCLGTNLTLFNQPAYINVTSGSGCTLNPTTFSIPAIANANQINTTLNVGTKNIVGCNVQICGNSTCSSAGLVTNSSAVI